MVAEPERPTPNLGGRNAFVGFIRQLLGTGSISVMVHGFPPMEDHLDPLLSVIGTGRVEFERFGSDVVVEREGTAVAGDRRRVLFQFKFSSTPAQQPIRPKELFDIVVGLRESERDANTTEALPSDYVLVTNRPISPGAAGLIEAATSDGSAEYLGGRGQKKAEREILRRLTIIRIDAAAFAEQIGKYAAERGVLDDELEAGTERLIGHLAQAAGGPGTITLDESRLCRLLTGSPEVRLITPASLRTVMLDDLAVFRERSAIPVVVCRRELADQLEESVTLYPVTALTGNGGSGKSTLSHQVLNGRLQPLLPDGFAIACVAASLRGRDIVRFASRWRTRSGTWPDEPPARALGRLRRAHPNAKGPTLLAAVDGADELMTLVPEARRPTEDLLELAFDLFRSNPPGDAPLLSVIISCRHERDLERLWRTYPSAIFRQALNVIPIGDFTDEELIEAARSSAMLDLAEHLGTHVRNLRGFPIADTRRTAKSSHANRRPLLPPIPTEVIQSLRHPAIWGCFAVQPEETRRGFLRARTSEMDDVARRYLSEFEEKVRLRRRNLDSVDLLSLLHRVAAHTKTRPDPFARVSDWIDPACSEGGVERSEARDVYDESVSYGLITRNDDETWMGAHPFVWRFLGGRG